MIRRLDHMARRALRRSTVLGFTLLIAACLPAAAEGVCVTCLEPSATYTCIAPPGAAQANNHAVQFQCIQDVAKQYGHGSCSVNRNQRGPCKGNRHVLAAKPVSAPAAIIAKPQPAPATPETSNKKKPKTVVDLAKRTAKSTSKLIKKSSRKVKKAASSTWRCISSLFSDC